MLDKNQAKADAKHTAHDSRVVVEAVAQAKPSTNDLAIAHALTQTASAQECVNALLRLGLRVEELAETLGVEEHTIRNWSDGSAKPGRAAGRALDDLRALVLVLEENGVTSINAVNWLRSHNRRWLDNKRPLDLLRTDPLLLFAAAENRDRLHEAPFRVEPQDAADQHQREAILKPLDTRGTAAHKVRAR